MELSVNHLYMIGLIASAAVFAVNYLAKKQGKKIGRQWLTVILFAVSIGLAAVWLPVTLPPWPGIPADPAEAAGAIMGYIGLLMTSGTALVGAATIIYNTLLKRVLEKMAESNPPDEAPDWTQHL